MPSWLKFVLLLLATGVLGLGLVIGGGVWWWGKNKDRIAKGGRAAQTEGRAFGRKNPRGACIDDGLTRLKSCAPLDFLCEAGIKIRLKSCISVAEDDGACKG